MKELTKKILEAGLVDKHLAAMMERWGTLDPGASDLVGRQQLTKESLEAFAEDIAGLVDPEQPVQETILDMEVSPPGKFTVPKTGDHFYGYWDKMGRLIVGHLIAAMMRTPVERGDYLVEPTHRGEKHYQVLDIEPFDKGLIITVDLIQRPL